MTPGDDRYIVTLIDSKTGLPLAVVGGNWVTAWRTGGLSAVAAKRLARPNAAVIAFIGCGVQARSHLAVFRDLFPLRETHAFGHAKQASISSYPTRKQETEK